MNVVMDSGALIAVDRRDQRMLALLDRIRQRGQTVVIPAGVVAQVWRNARQARLARLLGARDTEIVALDDASARAVGVLLGATRTRDVVDAHVVLVARERAAPVVSGDASDLRRIDPSLSVWPL